MHFYCVLTPPKQIKRGGIQNCKGKLAAFRQNKEVFAEFPWNACKLSQINGHVPADPLPPEPGIFSGRKESCT
jgi:hypothetical protein